MTAYSTRTMGSRLATLLRSGFVGIVATLVDLVLLWVLVGGMGLSPQWANIPALAGGLLVQFMGNKHYAFRNRSRDYVRQTTRFLVVEAGAFALNAGAFSVLVGATSIPYLVARLIGSAGVYLFFSYPLWHWVFRAPALVGKRME